MVNTSQTILYIVVEEARGRIIAFILTLISYALQITLDIVTLGIILSIQDLDSLTTLIFRFS